MLDHLGIQCADITLSAAFYDAALSPLGFSRVLDHGPHLGYGAQSPDFWISQQASDTGFRESHIAFTAADRDAVAAFFEAALAHGGTALHAPREWPEYHEHYFGAFVRDPDGNNVEAVCHRPE